MRDEGDKAYGIVTVRSGPDQELQGKPSALWNWLDVIPGEVLCILGPNGAGKSTTINILTATLAADKGEIRFGGKPITGNLRAYKQQLGIVPQAHSRR